MNVKSNSMYATMVASGDDPDAPERYASIIAATGPWSRSMNPTGSRFFRPAGASASPRAAEPRRRRRYPHSRLTGADSGFSAGGDLRMMQVAVEQLRAPEGVADVWRWIRREFGGIARLIAGSDTIFVAALNGAAAGVGLAWALTCDLVVASDRAVIVPAFGLLGLSPRSAPAGRSPAALVIRERWPTTYVAATSMPTQPFGWASCRRSSNMTDCWPPPTNGVRA